MTFTCGSGNSVDAEHVGDEGDEDVNTSFLFIERTQELGWVCRSTTPTHRRRFPPLHFP